MEHIQRLLEELRQELIEEIGAWQDPGLPNLDLEGRNGLYLAASAVQKAIRRNLVPEAMTYAGALVGRFPSYLPRRLAIIALEDVGQGAPRLAAKALLLASETKLRRQLGVDRTCTWLAGALAAAPGDRTACSLAVAATYHPRLRDDLLRMRTNEQLIEAIEGARPDLVPIVRAVGAIGELARRRQFESAIAALSLDLDELTLWISQTAHKLYLEGLGHGYPLAKILYDTSSPEIVERPLVTPRIGPWIAPALDRHTRAGFKAIRRFAGECDPLATLLRIVRPGRRPDTASWLIFAAEGAALGSTLAYKHTADLERSCAEACLADCLAPMELLDDGIRVVREHLPLLDSCRRRVLLG